MSILASTTSTDSGLLVDFKANVSEASTFDYVWNFGDNSTSALADPVHSYFAPTNTTVNYSVRLQVIGPNGTVGTAHLPVKVAGDILLVGPAFPIQSTAGASTALSVGAYGGVPPYTYFWTFGDLGSSHVSSPQHTFARSGSYLTTVYVNDSVGGSSSFSQFVVIPYANSTSSGSGVGSSVNPATYLGIGVGVLVVAGAVAIVVMQRRGRPPSS